MTTPISRKGKNFFNQAAIVGFKGGLRNKNTSKVLLKIFKTKKCEKLEMYMGKKVFYSIKTNQGRGKLLWGKIVSLHGRSGVVIAKFKKQLPPFSLSSFAYITPFPVQYIPVKMD